MQKFHIEAPHYVSASFRIEPTMTKAARLARAAKLADLDRRFAALAKANAKVRTIKRDIEREYKKVAEI